MGVGEARIGGVAMGVAVGVAMGVAVGVAGGRLGAAGVRLWLWLGVAWELLGVHWGSV